MGGKGVADAGPFFKTKKKKNFFGGVGVSVSV
jgi:hypothetical protein